MTGRTIIPFPKRDTASPFDRLTARLVMQRFHEGTLDAGVVEAFLLGIGLPLDGPSMDMAVINTTMSTINTTIGGRP